LWAPGGGEMIKRPHLDGGSLMKTCFSQTLGCLTALLLNLLSRVSAGRLFLLGARDARDARGLAPPLIAVAGW